MSARTPSSIGSLGPTMVTFALSMRADGKKPKTIRTYSDAAIWLAQRHPADTWAVISKPEIREHMAWLLENYSPAYASNQFRALQAFFRWLSEEEEIANPMTGMKPPAVPQKLVPVLGDGELEKLLATCKIRHFTDLRDQAIILMFASSGARLAEIAGLKVTDVDLEKLSAIVIGKASRMRIVRFSPEAAVAISRYLRARHAICSRYGLADQALWIGQRGPLEPNGIYQMLVRRGKKAGVKVNPHRFRHNFSHQWLVNGGNEGDLMQLAGWNSASMVSRYGASAAAERARSAYDRVMAG